MITTCPDCETVVRGAACACGWIVPPPFISQIEPRPVAKPYVPAKPETVERFKAAMKNFGHKQGPYWTPDRVRNAQQVNFIVIQANKFGPMSMQGRFLALCKEAGRITADNKLRMREMGEDEDYGRAA